MKGIFQKVLTVGMGRKRGLVGVAMLLFVNADVGQKFYVTCKKYIII